MFSPLVQNMIEQYGYPVLDADNLDEYLQANNDVVLFFTENAQKYPETNDVAMILPELVKAFEGRLTAAVISLPDQRTLRRIYGFREWPALVFVRGGEYLGVITRVQDWNDYLQKIEQILSSVPSRPPGFKIPVTMTGLNT